MRWYLVNSEDVGDIAAMLTLAMTVGFRGHRHHALHVHDGEPEAVRGAQGDGRYLELLLAMILVQAGVCAPHRYGLGLGLCGIAGQIVAARGFPFRMMWFTPW